MSDDIISWGEIAVIWTDGRYRIHLEALLHERAAARLEAHLREVLSTVAPGETITTGDFEPGWISRDGHKPRPTKLSLLVERSFFDTIDPVAFRQRLEDAVRTTQADAEREQAADLTVIQAWLDRLGAAG